MASASVGGRDIDRHRDDRKDARPTPLTIIHVVVSVTSLAASRVYTHGPDACATRFGTMNPA